MLAVSKLLMKFDGEMANFTELAPMPIQSVSCGVYMFVPSCCNLFADLMVRDNANGHNNS